MLKPKRSLGQNFFTNHSLAQKIVGLLDDNSIKRIIEIGPGTGSFTQYLYKTGKELVLIEKDDSLARDLSLQFPSVKIINKDVLDIRVEEISDANVRPEEVIVFGSLPYNISKPIIRNFLKFGIAENLYFIIQKEVAEKFTMKDKNNLLGLMGSIYADCKILLNISPGSFWPKPKVNSSLIHFTLKKDNQYLKHETQLEKVISIAFRNPRKTLQNNLKGQFEIKDENLARQRAEHLSLQDFLKIVNQ